MWQTKEEDGHLKLEWSTSMQGLDTTAPAPYVQGLVQIENFIIRNNTYIASKWTSVPFGDFNTYTGTSLLLGFGELAFPVAGSAGPTDVGDKFFYITQASSTSVTAHVADYIGTPSNSVGTVASVSGIALGAISWKTINQTTYIAVSGLAQLFQIAIDPVTSAITFTQLTAQLGAKYLGELNGRLLALNVFQLQTGPPPFTQNFPYQIAWSAGGEQYGVWNVLDLSGNATGAGFNNLPDVEDEITGGLFIGPTVYVIRRTGITEITPLNSGIQPFDFNHMWASHKGVGTVFPDTIAQFGPKGGFVAKDDIYTIGIEGIATIGGTAKRAIYTDLGKASVVQASMVALNINGTPELCYILAMQITDNTNATILRTYIYGFETKQWTRLTFATGTTLSNVATLIQIQSLLLSNTIATTTQDAVSNDTVVVALKTFNAVPTFFYIPLLPTNDAAIGNVDESLLLFPNARIQTLKDVTIDAVLVYAEGPAGSVIQPTVDNVQYTELQLGTGPDSAKNLYTAYPVSQVALTALQPQLKIETSGTIALGEISMYGTVAQGRRP